LTSPQAGPEQPSIAYLLDFLDGRADRLAAMRAELSTPQPRVVVGPLSDDRFPELVGLLPNLAEETGSPNTLAHRQQQKLRRGNPTRSRRTNFRHPVLRWGRGPKRFLGGIGLEKRWEQEKGQE